MNEAPDLTRILVLFCGGTISMHRDEKNGNPVILLCCRAVVFARAAVA